MAGHGAGAHQHRLAMLAAPPSERRTLLFVLLAMATLALVAILLPFYGTLLWAVILAVLFMPFNRWLLRHLGGRRTPAALATLVVVVLIAVLPLIFISTSLFAEASALFERLQNPQTTPTAYFRTLYDALPAWLADLLTRLGLGNFDALQERLTALLSQGSKLLTSQALKLGQNTFELVVSLFVMLYIAFFLIRDGDALRLALREAIPLSERHQRDLYGKFAAVVRATVKGNLIVAAVQGALGGLAFWVLDIHGALLWAVLMGFLSLLPAVGAAIVWLPVALWLLASGATLDGIGLIAFGIAVIGLVDNVLRPRLVGKDTRLPDWMVLVTTLGGIAVFGLNGFVLGPLIAAMFFAVWQITIVHRRGELPATPIVASETSVDGV